MNSLLGCAAIVALLFIGLRSPLRVFDVLAPLAAAVVMTAAVQSTGGPLSIFHLVGLLLVVAVGSNYSLFFDRKAAAGRDPERTVLDRACPQCTRLDGRPGRRAGADVFRRSEPP